MRVLVPFGRGNRTSEAMVLSIENGAKRRGLKAIASILDDAPVLDAAGIRMALWMRERYFCTMYDAVRTILPTDCGFALKPCIISVMECSANRPSAKARQCQAPNCCWICCLPEGKGGGGCFESSLRSAHSISTESPVRHEAGALRNRVTAPNSGWQAENACPYLAGRGGYGCGGREAALCATPVRGGQTALGCGQRYTGGGLLFYWCVCFHNRFAEKSGVDHCV